MTTFFDFYFYWLGVATAVVFALLGYCVTVGIVVGWAWNKTKDVFSISTILLALRERNGTEPQHGEGQK